MSDAGKVDADLERRFGGLARLYGVAGAARIRAAHVVVVGVGGVGSWAAEALARSGVGQMTLIDLDHVSESNINRQVHALTSTLGQSKVGALRDRVSLINPVCQVNCVEDFVDATNWPQLIGCPVAAVIDACDQVVAKTAMAAWARQTGVGYISVGAAGGKRAAHLVDIADLAQVTHDPLLAQVRNRLRKHHAAPSQGRKIGIPCVYSSEAVRPPDAGPTLDGGGDSPASSDGSLNCHGYGSVVSVTATFGLCAAGWVFDYLSQDAKMPRAAKSRL